MPVPTPRQSNQAESLNLEIDYKLVSLRELQASCAASPASRL